MKTFKSKVLSINRITSDLINISFSVPPGFRFKPGQYVILEFKEGGKITRRPYSIASKNVNELDLCVNNVGGIASNYLFNLKEGDKVSFSEPTGKFTFSLESKNKEIYFIAIGTGIAPFRPMIYSLIKNKTKINLFFGNKLKETTIYDKEFSKLANENKNFIYYNILSRTSDNVYPHQGHVQDFITRLVKQNSRAHFYLCGLKEMIDSCVNLLHEKGVQDEQIFYERYD